MNPPFHPLLLLFFYTTALDLTQCVHRIESHHLGQKQSMPWHCLLPFPSLSVGGESDIRVLCISIKMQCFDLNNQNHQGITYIKYFLVEKPLPVVVFQFLLKALILEQHWESFRTMTFACWHMCLIFSDLPFGFLSRADAEKFLHHIKGVLEMASISKGSKSEPRWT